MKKFLMILPLVFLLCFAFSCKQSEQPTEEPAVDAEADVAAIRALLDEWYAAYNSGDADKLVSLYSDDALIMGYGEPTQVGKEAILASFKEGFEKYDLHVDNGIIEDVRVSGDLGMARGTDYGTMTPKDGGEPIKGNVRWVAVYERQADGTWKTICEISNKNVLPESQQEEE